MLCNPISFLTQQFSTFTQHFFCKYAYVMCHSPSETISKCKDIFYKMCITQNQYPVCDTQKPIKINSNSPKTVDINSFEKISIREIELSIFMNLKQKNNWTGFEYYLHLNCVNVIYEEKLERMKLLIRKYFPTLCHSKEPNSDAIAVYSGRQWGFGKVQKVRNNSMKIKFNSMERVLPDQTVKSPFKNILLISKELMENLLNADEITHADDEVIDMFDSDCEEINKKLPPKNLIELTKLSEKIIAWYQAQRKLKSEKLFKPS